MSDNIFPEPSDRPEMLARIQSILKSPWVIALMVLALGAALFLIAPPSEWQAAFQRAEPSWLISAILIVMPHEMLKVMRMEQLVPCVKPQRTLHAKIVFGMSCVAQLPVGTMGGDIYRVMRLEECGAKPKDAAAATFLIRAIGFATTLTLAGIGGAVVLDSLLPLFGPVLGASILLLLGLSQNPPGFLGALVSRADDTGKGAFGRFLSIAARLLRHVFREAADLSRAQIARVLGFTLGLYALRSTIFWFCLLAVGLEVSYFVALAGLAVGNLASSIPSPTGNVGLREGGMVGVLATLGTAVAPATIGALLFRAVMILGSTVGLGVTTVLHRIFGAKEAEEAA